MGLWNAADIVNTVLAGIGIGLTAVGLAVVFWQVRKARGAAEAAREAASEAREVMAQRATATDLGSIHTQLRTILDDLRAQRYESAWLTCQEVREHLVALRVRPGLEGQQERITEALAILSSIQRTLGLDAPENADIDMSDGIRSMLDLVVELREHALFSEREGNDHEQRSR